METPVKAAGEESREENTPGWIPAEDDGRTKTPFWCPLLACRMPVFTSKAQDRKAPNSPLACCCHWEA
ncbi:hypothetical protein SRHO_G00275670 [Serrasalmus rhombeus]